MIINRVLLASLFLFVCMMSCTQDEIETPIEVETPNITNSKFVLDSKSKITVHEWGTITSQHLPDGTQLGRLNKIAESEVLPDFVYQFEPKQTQNNPERALAKSPIIPGRPDVTMRLETPVMYFYSANSELPTEPFTVDVSFRGGLLNEYYPNAKASVSQDIERINSKIKAGVIKEWNGDVLNNFVKGNLVWTISGLKDSALIPETDDVVWLAPRAVEAKFVTNDSGESEKYLFYRGVAHLHALLQTQLTDSEIILSEAQSLHWLEKDSLIIPQTWVVEIAENGNIAFAELGSIKIIKSVSNQELRRVPTFNPDSLSSVNLDDLKQSMKLALMKEGLFNKEAVAMLKTWESSYFQNPGKRVFYIVPNEWIDYHLPIDISVSHELTRAFIGRIDILDLK